MANLYTKTGDKGQTSLVGGSRVSKSSLRVACYGTIDEANSMLGLAYAQTDREYIRTTVHRIQGRLFALGAELGAECIVNVSIGTDPETPVKGSPPGSTAAPRWGTKCSASLSSTVPAVITARPCVLWC